METTTETKLIASVNLREKKVLCAKCQTWQKTNEFRSHIRCRHPDIRLEEEVFEISRNADGLSISKIRE